LEMRCDLMAALREHIKERGLTQSKAAEQLGISQPRVSALIKGNWRDFSADMLLLLATRAGLRPTLSLTPPAQRTSHMLDDVARILSLTPEDRLRELANAAKFFAAARRADNGHVRS
jgi:predicted XRE-type DNA-binding protein